MHMQCAQAFMDAAGDAVILIDAQGSIAAVNAAAERSFGYASSELLGKTIDVLLPVGPPRPGRSEATARRRDGSQFAAGYSVGSIAGSSPPSFAVFVHDLSAHRQALAALQADRDRAREREAEAHHSHTRLLAVSRMATMGEMAAAIAHEMNQPLTAISNYARACERFAAADPPHLADLQECMGEIAGETQRAADIIRELRRMVRGSADERESRDLAEIVRRTRPLILADARVHEARVGFDLAEEELPVLVDAVEIQQVLLNLTRNALEAVQARPAGEREIRIGVAAAAPDQVELTVADSGPGIDPKVQDVLFDPFVTTKPMGTGLGLSIGRTIAAAHGGELTCRASPSAGACFSLRLPRHGKAEQS